MAKWARHKRRHVPAALNKYYAANGNMIGQPAAVEPEAIDPYSYDDGDAIRQALCALDCKEASAGDSGENSTPVLQSEC